jgi:hypothetical protein
VQRVVCQGGELSERVSLGKVAVMALWSWRGGEWAEVMAGERGIHGGLLGGVGYWVAFLPRFTIPPCFYVCQMFIYIFLPSTFYFSQF